MKNLKKKINSNFLTRKKWFQKKISKKLTNVINIICNPYVNLVLNEDTKKTNRRYEILEKLRKNIIDKDLLIDILESLYNIFRNILENPLNLTYRKINLNSKFYKNYLEQYKEVNEFVEDSDCKLDYNNFLLIDSPLETIQNITNDIINFAIFYSKFIFIYLNINIFLN